MSFFGSGNNFSHKICLVYINISIAAAAAKLLQSCPTLCDPIDGSPPGSPIPGILQARTLQWVAISEPSFVYYLNVCIFPSFYFQTYLCIWTWSVCLLDRIEVNLKIKIHSDCCCFMVGMFNLFIFAVVND